MEAKDIKWKYGRLDTIEIHKMYEEIDINCREQYLNNSLLHIACNFADSEAVKILLNRGLDSNIENENQDRPLHSLILRDSDYNDIDEIKNCTKLLLDNKASVMRKNCDGKTPVILAAEKGEAEMIELFINYNLKLTMTDKEGNNALHIACNNIYDEKEEDYLKIVKLLLEYGLDIEDKNQDGETPLDIAKKRENNKLIAILLGEDETTDLNTKGQNLYEAIKNSDYEATISNIEMGEEVNITIDENGEFKGMTLLGMACYKLDIKMIEILLNNGANPNFKSSDGKNSLGELLGYNKDMYFDNDAVRENKIDTIFKLLKEHGLNINDVVDNEGNTALIKGCQYINKNTSYNGNTLSGLIVKNLLKHNCDVDLTNLQGQSALMFLCETKRSEALNLQIELLEMGANIDLIDKNGNTALIYAANNDDDNVAKEMTEMLFEFGNPNVEHINNDGNSALDIATTKNNEVLVKFLLMNM